jgi:hypothetical protein
MKRTEFWMTMAVAIATWIVAPPYQAAAQESAGAEAGAQSDAGAQADTGAQAEASADTQAANQSADASASNQSSADQQSAQSDTQATATSDTAAGQSSTQANDSAQATGEGQADAQKPLPAPSRQDASQDRDATQSADQNQANQRQAADRPDATQRDARTDASADVNADAQRNRDMRDRDRDGRDSRDRDRRGDRRDGRNRADFRAHIHFGAFTNGGLAITTVAHDSLFFHAGLREGDILISVDGHPIRSDADFHRFVVYQPGHRVPVVILRDGHRETVYIVYEENMVDDTVVYDDQPQAVANAGAFLGVVFDAGNPDAAVVVAVSPGSPAEQAGLQRGDIIVALNGQEVRSYRDAISMINSMQPGDRLGIEFSRRVDDQTQAILAGKPGPGARSATLPQREVRGYRGTPQDVPPANETDIRIRRENENRGILNLEPRQDGRRPLIPRLRN